VLSTPASDETRSAYGAAPVRSTVAVTPDGAGIVHWLEGQHGADLGAKNGAELAQPRGFDGPFTSVAVTPDGARIIGNDNTGKAANDMVKGYFANRCKTLSNIADKVTKYD
jgi:hypothetical protein